MRLRIGPVPDSATFRPEQGGWHKLKRPPFGLFLLLALPVSVLIASGVLAAWAALARLHGMDGSTQIVLTPGALLAAVAMLGALVLVHELIHAAALAGRGRGSATTLGFWPQTFTAYVYYDGELSRSRYLVVGLMPFLLLSVFPLLVGLLVWLPSWVVVMSTINAFMSSGDLLGSVLLVVQTPRSAVVRSKGLETWWRSPA